MTLIPNARKAKTGCAYSLSGNFGFFQSILGFCYDSPIWGFLLNSESKGGLLSQKHVVDGINGGAAGQAGEAYKNVGILKADKAQFHIHKEEIWRAWRRPYIATSTLL